MNMLEVLSKILLSRDNDAVALLDGKPFVSATGGAARMVSESGAHTSI